MIKHIIFIKFRWSTVKKKKKREGFDFKTIIVPYF